jgi:hypothetical protein
LTRLFECTRRADERDATDRTAASQPIHDLGAAENQLMNRHPGLFSLALLTCILTLTATAARDARAQTPAPARALDAIKTSDSVTAAVPQIAAHVNAQVQKLTSGDPAASAAARDVLIETATGAKPAFLASYAAAIDSGIAPALKHQQDLVRLNAAIVVARVAERTDDAGLKGSTMALLNDPSHFVVLWGLKSARIVIPAILRNPVAKADDILAAVVKAAAKHGTGPIGSPVVIEAYDALTVDALNSNAKVKPTNAAITTAIPYVHQLLQQRAAAYRTSIPPEPVADGRGTLFLVNARVWGLHSPAQKLTAVQAMSDLMGMAAQQATTAAPADKEQLGEMIGNVAKALAVIPETKAIQEQLAPATKVDARMAPDQIVAAVAGVPAALKKVKEFAALTPPPAAVAAAPAPAAGTTQPSSTSPTTAPTATAPASTAAATVSP